MKYLSTNLLLAILTILAAEQSFAAPLVHREMSREQRYKIMSRHLSPAPGQMVEVDPKSVINGEIQDPLKLFGQVKIKPPKNQCLIITKNFDEPDIRVCEEKFVNFRVEELNKAGHLVWHIKTGDGDFGNPYHWTSPHRLADVIPAGEKLDVLSLKVPLRNCTALVNKENRRLILELMNGSYWIIHFPPVDQLIDQPAPLPNLFVSGLPGKGGITPDAKLPQNKHQQVYVKAEKGDPVTKHWAIPDRGTFVMNSSNFNSSDTGPGMQGTCRYQLKGAPSDPDSGWIECHNTDNYDVVLTHLTCAKILLTN